MSAEPAASDDKEWATADAANDGGGAPPERILNQDEIINMGYSFNIFKNTG